MMTVPTALILAGGDARSKASKWANPLKRYVVEASTVVELPAGRCTSCRGRAAPLEHGQGVDSALWARRRNRCTHQTGPGGRRRPAPRTPPSRSAASGRTTSPRRSLRPRILPPGTGLALEAADVERRPLGEDGVGEVDVEQPPAAGVVLAGAERPGWPRGGRRRGGRPGGSILLPSDASARLQVRPDRRGRGAASPCTATPSQPGDEHLPPPLGSLATAQRTPAVRRPWTRQSWGRCPSTSSRSCVPTGRGSWPASPRGWSSSTPTSWRTPSSATSRRTRSSCAPGSRRRWSRRCGWRTPSSPARRSWGPPSGSGGRTSASGSSSWCRSTTTAWSTSSTAGGRASWPSTSPWSCPTTPTSATW